jgi:hypothetical protein
MRFDSSLSDKRVPKEFFGCPHRRNLCGFQVEPFLVPGRTLFGFHVGPSVEKVLHGTKKGSSKDSLL